jgi:hypothetical protein
MAGRRILIAGADAVGATAAHVLSDVRAIDLCLVPSTVETRRLSALRRAGLTVLRTQ